MTNTKSIDPMKGVVNPDSLIEQIKALKAGHPNAKSYIRGSLQVLERKPPNKFIVPLLRTALNKFG